MEPRLEQPSKSVSLTVADGLATLTLDREHGNAIDSDMVDGTERPLHHLVLRAARATSHALRTHLSVRPA